MTHPLPKKKLPSSATPRSLLYLGCEVARPHPEGLTARHRDLRLRRRSPPVDAPLARDVAGVFALTPDTSVQSKDGVGGGRGGSSSTRHRSSKSQQRARIFRELVHIAAEQGHDIPLGVSTADALQECLDRAVALYRFAVRQVDNLTVPDAFPPDTEYLGDLPSSQDPLFEVISNPQGPDIIQPHRYVTMEREARLEIEKLAAMMTQLGIAERVVRVAEAQATLVVAAVREAAIEAGLSHDQVRLLGSHLRDRLEDARVKQPTPGARKDGSSARAQAASAHLRQLENR